MKGILRNWHRYLLWATVSFVFWAWVVNLITDAPAKNKVILYADVPALDRDALSLALEEDLPENIRFVEARLFTEEIFSPTSVAKGDLFLVSAAVAESYLPGLRVMERSAFPEPPGEMTGDVIYGIVVHDQNAGIHTAASRVLYDPEEVYYLCFNPDSVHLGAWNGSADDAALRVAETFFALP